MAGIDPTFLVDGNLDIIKKRWLLATVKPKVQVYATVLQVKALDFEYLRGLNIPWSSVKMKANQQELRKDRQINQGSLLHGTINYHRAQCMIANYTRWFFVVDK